MVDAAAAESSLRDSEAAANLSQQVVGGDADVLVSDVSVVAVLMIEVAGDRGARRWGSANDRTSY